MRTSRIFLAFWGFIAIFIIPVVAQTDSSLFINYPAINENALLHTKWRYTYTTHQASNTIIHKADKDYQYYVFLKYDYSYEMFLNGKLSEGSWQLNEGKNRLFYPFRKIDWWSVVQFDENMLVLEYYAFGKIAYRYHFVSLEERLSPFKKAANELPDVLVDNLRAKSDKLSYRYTKDEKGKRRLLRRSGKNKTELAKTEKAPAVSPALPFIQIELVGGGFYGGMDKVYRNNLVIKNNGQLVKEFQSELNGLRVTRKLVPRKDLDSLMGFLERCRFFEWQQIYQCESRSCMEKYSQGPRPIALRLAVTYGIKRKVIVIPVWDGRGRENSVIDYPKELDLIVQTLENMVIN